MVCNLCYTMYTQCDAETCCYHYCYFYNHYGYNYVFCLNIYINNDLIMVMQSPTIDFDFIFRVIYYAICITQILKPAVALVIYIIIMVIIID